MVEKAFSSVITSLDKASTLKLSVIMICIIALSQPTRPPKEFRLPRFTQKTSSTRGMVFKDVPNARIACLTSLTNRP